MDSFSLSHLPIVKEYANRMGLVETLDSALVCGMKISPGKVLLGLVMNVLCGRSPLYRVEEFFRMRDVEVLLGEGIRADQLGDDTLGRVLDRVHAYGTWKIFSEVCIQAFKNFGVNCEVVHHDTTSISVWGEYRPSEKDPFHIRHGFSKDKRPDLKQFIISLLCAEGNLPCHAAILDGNAADKKTNRTLIGDLPRIMARHGVSIKDFIYVADSALATQENFTLMHDSIRFITRLPENFGACGQLISKALASDSWQEAGRLNHRVVSGKDICASYRFQEQDVTLYGRTYRAVVVHSDAHDRRRQKRIEKAVRNDRQALMARLKEIEKKEFFCLPDAEAAVQSLQDSFLHHITFTFGERPIYGRGRPSRDMPRQIRAVRYRLSCEVRENTDAVQQLREEAGCFVLLTNVPKEQKSGMDILTLYKEQDGIEKNFGFLKEPLFVNDVFLKKPRRIEALGLVMVIALLVWRLMERTMRMKIKKERTILPGWNNCSTAKPTSFMMASKFSPVMGGVKNGRRFLFSPLDEVQLAYLHALNVQPACFTQAPPQNRGIRSG